MANIGNIATHSEWQEAAGFEDMGLGRELLHSMHEYGFEVPTRLQRDALPHLLKGHDVVVDAPVNSGKTATVCISVLQNTNASNLQCQALILTPCFETAFRTSKIVLALGSFSVQCHICTDKADLQADTMRINKGSQIVIATPDCAQDLIQNGALMINRIRMFVLDRLDDMFAEGYGEFIEDIFQSIPRSAQVVFLLSKAFPEFEMLTAIMRSPVFISHDAQEPKPNNPQTLPWSGHEQEEEESGASSRPIEGDSWRDVPQSSSDYPVEEPLESAADLLSSRPVEPGALGSEPQLTSNDPVEERSESMKASFSTCPVEGQPLETAIVSFSTPPPEESVTLSSPARPPEKKTLESVSSSSPARPQEKENEIYDNFADMGLKSKLLRGIADYGLSGPSTTQQCAIGPILKTQDVIVYTPSGADDADEAATYSIPILQKIDVSNKECQALILAPSPERARQIQAVILALGTVMNVKCFSCGSTASKDATDLKEGSQIITGTPGRVLGTITYTNLKVSNIKMFVVDQSDGELAEKSWASMYTLFQQIPDKPQVVVLSSTILKYEATSKILYEPVYIRVAKETTSEGSLVHIEVKKDATFQSAPIHIVVKKEETSKGPTAGPSRPPEVKPCDIVPKQDKAYNFADMGLRSELLRGITGYGLKHPSITQQCAIGAILKDQDVIVRIQPGTDKADNATAYSIPLLQKLDILNKHCQALILTSTPERAKEIQENILALGILMKVKCFSCGLKAKEDAHDLKDGSQIITGTPGRVLGTITYTNLKKTSIKMFVVDLSDGSLSDGAWAAMVTLFQLIPKEPQVVIFSPTILKQEETSKIMHKPVYINVSKEAASKSAPVRIEVKKEVSSKNPPTGSARPLEDKSCEIQSKQYETYNDMGLKSELLQGIADYSLNRPSITQQCAIGPILMTRDVIVQTQHGADKTDRTAAYSIPVLQKLDVSNKQCQALILTSTPERAREIQEHILGLGKLIMVKCFSCGSQAKQDANDLKEGSQIITGTPGRVLGTVTFTNLKKASIKMFIVDESDESLSKGAWAAVVTLFQLIPKKPQVVILSSTILNQEVTAKIMHKPMHIVVIKDFKQFYVAVQSEEHKVDALNSLCQTMPATHIVVFYHNREKVGWLKKMLIANNLTASAIHGNMPQDQRDSIIKAFSSGSLRILISTDLQLQNADVGYVSLVINYDLPAKKENYRRRIALVDGFVHKGVAINLVTRQEMPKLKEIEKLCSAQIPEMSVEGYSFTE
ncbi:MAG: P-loop containing nucleoside triphosphate hydrolase protein [Benniella sp.]|nr:MAG: P-loop containing nucleoside triphosphate hydrolase protein [Benniella sp.]